MHMNQMITALVFVALVGIVNASWGTCFTPLPLGYNVTDSIPAHYQWAKLLYDNVAGTNKTSYQNFNITVMWGDESCDNEYLSETDCSGVVTAVLQRAYNLSITDNWAYASIYAETTKNQTFGFTNIKLADAAVGDIFSIDYYIEPGTYGNTGHMGFISAAPFIIPPSNPIIPNTVQWALPVLDQTGSPHSPNDSRSTASAGLKGLGTGFMRVYTDATTGDIAGYTWSLNRTKYYNQSYNVFYIAHLNQTYMYDHPFTAAPTNPPYPPWMDDTPSPTPPVPTPGPSGTPTSPSGTPTSPSGTVDSSAASMQPVLFLAFVAMLFIIIIFV